uniref:Uncharacterized protein n=1 Tax=Oryza meridionalis TaxID=40149 RepID=A0A0E0EXH2_9ORYZ
MLATASSSSTIHGHVVLLARRYIKPSTRERAAAWEDQSCTVIVPFPAPSSSCYYRLLFAAYIGKLCRLFSATVETSCPPAAPLCATRMLSSATTSSSSQPSSVNQRCSFVIPFQTNFCHH